MATDTLDPPGPLDIARDRLGEPEASFRVGAGRFWTKLGLGTLLVAYGAAANVVAWRLGFWGVDHVTLLVLFAPPVTGLSILRQLYATRGLAYHVYPAGLLRVQGREVMAFPWGELTEVTLTAEQATPLVVRGEGGRVVDCRLVVTAPVFRLTSAGVVLKRGDGEFTTVTPAVAEYPELVEEVTSRTFAERWPRLLAELGAGGSVAFGPWAATPSGLRVDGKTVPWGEVRFDKIAEKQMVLERVGPKADKWAAQLESIPFPHLLIALLAELQPVGTA